MNLRAHYHVPEVTVQLGTVLDVRFSTGPTRVTVDDWHDWLLLTDENAMESERPRLWLVDGKHGITLGDDELGPAPETYERWTSRSYDKVSDVELPDGPIGYLQGRVSMLGYRSDKWGKRGEFHDYDHDFGSQPPMLYTNRADVEESTAAVIVGGDMEVTEQGID